MKKLVKYLKSLRSMGYRHSDEFLEKAKKRSVGEVWTQPSGRVVRKIAEGSIVPVAAGKSSGKKLAQTMKNFGRFTGTGSEEEKAVKKLGLATAERMKQHPVKAIREKAAQIHEAITRGHKELEKHEKRREKHWQGRKEIQNNIDTMGEEYNAAVAKHAEENGIKAKKRKGGLYAPITEEHKKVIDKINALKTKFRDKTRHSLVKHENQTATLSAELGDHYNNLLGLLKQSDKHTKKVANKRKSKQ